MKFGLTWFASILLVMAAGSWVLNCQATAAAQWMGAFFFVTWIVITLSAFKEGSQRVQTMGSSPENIRKRSFELNVATGVFLIVYTFSVLIIGLLAYNTDGFEQPYGTLYVLTTMLVYGACFVMYQRIGLTEGRLDEIEKAEQEKEDAKRVEEEIRVKKLLLSLTPEEISKVVQERTKRLDDPD